MRIVVDANIAAAALIRPGGWTARQLEREDVPWLGPFLADTRKIFAARASLAERVSPNPIPLGYVRFA